MFQSISKYRLIFLVFSVALVLLGGVLSGCGATIDPITSYQGRLTDASGDPLNGTYTFVFGLYTALSGGTPIYTETEQVVVTNGLFDTLVGPTSAELGDLRSELFSRPLWLQVTINGETLTPRQRLYGAPYAFTLMPGAAISSTLTIAAADGRTDAILTVINNAPAGTGTNAPLPALRVQGVGGLELVGVGNSGAFNTAGTIYSSKADNSSIIRLVSNASVMMELDDNDDNSDSSFVIYNGDNEPLCWINELGNLHCVGNSSFGGTKSAVVSAQGEQRKLYTMESPEVWFEDFGSGTLVDGIGIVTIDALFADTVNLNDYHVFVTPLGDCQGLYVTNKTATGFEVRELGGGTASIAFDYRLVAKRLGYEADRMELVEPPAVDEAEDEK